MGDQLSLEPYEESRGTGGPSSPHLADYWQIVSRRIWLVLVVFGITSASAIWAVSQQQAFYQSQLSLQVTDPLQRTRSLTPGARISGMEIFTDPIQSEIEVLKTGPISGAVVDSLGLRLWPETDDPARSELLREVRVDPGAPTGTYELVYGADGEMAVFRRGNGEELGSGPVGEVLDAGILRFVPQPPPVENRVHRFTLLTREEAIPMVRDRLSAAPRESTNIIDVTYTSPDPHLAPEILNAAAEALRAHGARRVRVAASGDVAFIEEQLDSARQQLSRSLQAIREFKETRQFTSLSVQEQELVNQMQETTRNIEELERQRSALSGLVRDVEDAGVREIDMVAVQAELPDGVDAQIRSVIDRIRSREDALQELLTTERMTRSHPQAQSLLAQIHDLENELLSAVRANLRVVEDRLEALNRRNSELRERQRQFPQLENELQTLELQQSLDEGTYEFLLSQLYQSRITEAAASPYVDVIDPAAVSYPVRTRGNVNIVLGALLGLILGVGAAFFLEYLDRTVRTSSDVESFLGIPVLGIIPRLRRKPQEREEIPGGAHLPLVVALDPLDPAAEAYRNLRMNLTFLGTDEEPLRSLLISSPGPREGKSTTALNFSVMLAQQGERVLLVDSDLRRPVVHRSLDLLREPGLTNLLIGNAESREAIRPNVLPNLDVLPSGPFPPNPSELLSSGTMTRLLEEFEEKYSQVILDSPPVLAVTDSSVLGGQADGLLLVLRSGETEQRAAERAVEQLRRLNVRILGAVLNEVSSPATDESYYLQYYYSYEPVERNGWDRLWEGITRARFW